MSAGKTGKKRISQAEEAAILGWFRLAPTLGIEPGLREIRPDRFSQIKGECQIRSLTIKSYGRAIRIQVKRSTDEATLRWGSWYASCVIVPSEDGSHTSTHLSLEGKEFWQYAD